jgi:hypothetical protein
MPRSRHGTGFVVRLIGVELYDSVQQDFVDYFDGIETYCVSVEMCESGGYHLHTYLLFFKPTDCFEVGEYIRVFHNSTVDVRPCKSRRNWLKYITKEDEEPYFNCKLSELSFNLQEKRWCANTSTFKFGDPLVLEHHNKWRFL